MYIFSLQFNMTYVIKLVLLLVGIQIAIAAGELNNLLILVGDIASK
jgi:hypothetical protein